MASTSSIVSMAMPLTYTTQNKQPIVEAFFKPLPIRPSKQITTSKKFVVIKATSIKEKAVVGLTTGVLTASMVVPDVAQAAEGLSPSLKNFLLSIVSGGVVLGAIIGAIIGVSNFDPVKRGTVLHQRGRLPYSITTMTIAGLAITGVVWYGTMYAMKKPEASAVDVAKVATGVGGPKDTHPRK